MVGRVTGILVALLLAAALISPAHGVDGIIDSYEVNAELSAEGKLTYAATIELGTPRPSQFTIQLQTRADAPDQVIQHFTISEIAVQAGAVDLPVQIDQSDQAITITIDSGQTSGPITLSYQVWGSTHAGSGQTTIFNWPVIQGVSLPIQRALGTVRPGTIPVDYRCQSGPVDDLRTCSLYGGGTEYGPDLKFEERQLQAGELVVPAMTYEAGQMPVTERLDHRWTLDRAFGHSMPNLLLALLTAVIGLVLLAHLNRRIGGDAPGGEPVTVARFAPVGAGQSAFEVRGAVRPGLVGTLTDEFVDPVDITATIIDLATRGHLRITELDPDDRYSPLDWRITRRPGTDALAGYEQALIAAIDPEQGLLVSQLESLQDALPQVQDGLYQEVVNRGWFARRPDQVRGGYGRIGWMAVGGAVMVLALLVAFTSFGLFGLVLVGLAAGFLVLSGRMPARTAQGSAVLAGLTVLAGQLRVHPTDEMPTGHALGELSKVLPYAIVLGGAQRWLDALAAADDDDEPDATELDWYHAPPDWHLDRLPESLDALITTMQGRLFRR